MPGIVKLVISMPTPWRRWKIRGAVRIELFSDDWWWQCALAALLREHGCAVDVSVWGSDAGKLSIGATKKADSVVGCWGVGSFGQRCLSGVTSAPLVVCVISVIRRKLALRNLAFLRLSVFIFLYLVHRFLR